MRRQDSNGGSVDQVIDVFVVPADRVADHLAEDIGDRAQNENRRCRHSHHRAGEVMIARWTNYCRGVPRQPRVRKAAPELPRHWPHSEPFHVTWERALGDHVALGRRLPYALLAGFWDARTLRRVER